MHYFLLLCSTNLTLIFSTILRDYETYDFIWQYDYESYDTVWREKDYQWVVLGVVAAIGMPVF